jgi:PRC-barrel domain
MSDNSQRHLALAVLLLVPVLVITAAVASAESQSEAAENGNRQVGAVAEEYSKQSARSAQHGSLPRNESKQPPLAAPDRSPGDSKARETSRPALDKQAQDVPLIEAKPDTADERSKQPPPAAPDRSPASSDSKTEQSSQAAREKPKQDVPTTEGKPETSDEQSKQAPSSTSDRPPAPDTEAEESPKQPVEEKKPEQEVRPAESQPQNGSTTAKTLKPIAPDEAVGILGKKVQGPAGEVMGMVVDVLVDAEGKPRAAVIDFGGFLGVGTRTIATDWQLLQFRPADRTQPVLLSLGKEELRAAPEYKPSIQPAEIVAPPPPSETPVAADAEK